MTKPLVFFAFFLQAIISSSYGQNITTFTTLTDKANAAVDAGDYKLAISLGQESVTRFGTADAYNNLGYFYQRNGNRDLALENYRLSIQKNSKQFMAYRNRAEYELDTLRDFKPALADIDYAIKYSPQENLLFLNYLKGRILGEYGKLVEAVAVFDKCLKESPYFVGALAFRGLYKLRNNLIKEAEPDFEFALKLDPKNVLGLYGLGLISLNKNNPFDAISYFSQGLTIQPKLYDVLFSRGYAYSMKGDVALSIEDLNKSVSLNPYNPDAYYVLGNDYFSLGDYPNAALNYKKCLERAPEAGQAYTQLIVVLGRAELFAEAGLVYQDYKRKRLKTIIEESKWTFFDTYAKVLTVDIPRGDWWAALTDINLAIPAYQKEVIDKKVYTFTEGTVLKAYILKALGRNEEAISEYKKALQDGNNQPDVIKALQYLDQQPQPIVNTQRQEYDQIFSAKETQPVYYAIFIAENEYADGNFKSLSHPIADLNAFRDVLVSQYDFAPQHIIFLKNTDRDEVLTAIEKMTSIMNADDNLLIYYAGHGFAQNDRMNRTESFWVPAKAKWQNTASYISRQEVLRRVNLGNARHILIISDACFSSAGTMGIGPDTPADIRETYRRISRSILTSGRGEVPDESMLAHFLKVKLMDNREKFITARTLYENLKPAVINASGNRTYPLLTPIPETGDEGGDFVFTRKSSK